MKNPRDWAIFARGMAEAHAPQPRDPRLKLAYPLASREILGYQVDVRGVTTETQVTFQSVGRNGVRRVIDALLRWARTERADERVLTIHTQIFASRHDTIPAFKFVQTIIINILKGTPELGCRWDDLFISIVDETGIHRPPVCRAKTFL
jgi:hypothetical protein